MYIKADRPALLILFNDTFFRIGYFALTAISTFDTLKKRKKTGQCIGSKLQITEKRPTSYSLRAFDFNIPGGKKP